MAEPGTDKSELSGIFLIDFTSGCSPPASA
jgi:hypothetical protein